MKSNISPLTPNLPAQATPSTTPVCNIYTDQVTKNGSLILSAFIGLHSSVTTQIMSAFALLIYLFIFFKKENLCFEIYQEADFQVHHCLSGAKKGITKNR